jgi:hypothetical protein
MSLSTQSVDQSVALQLPFTIIFIRGFSVLEIHSEQLVLYVSRTEQRSSSWISMNLDARMIVPVNANRIFTYLETRRNVNFIPRAGAGRIEAEECRCCEFLTRQFIVQTEKRYCTLHRIVQSVNE